MEGGNPHQRKCLTSLNLLANRRCSIQSKGTKRKTAIYSLFHSHGSLKLMQERVWWSVCNPCDTQLAPSTQRVEIHVIWTSDFCLVATGFPQCMRLSMSINVIPTNFVSRLRRSSLSIVHLQCDCRVQVSVRLLKMLRRIVCKVKIFLAIAMLVTSS